MTNHGAEELRPPEEKSHEASSDESQQPEYELTDYGRPPSENEEDADEVREEAQPEYELVDLTPPPPDDLVIEREAAWRHWIQQNWILGSFIVIFAVVIFSDIGLSSVLPPKAWGQARPEVEYIRNSMFTILLVIIGYFFGERRRR
jgi:hypothetical protein